VRVIAGQLGGRKLVAPRGATTRPTSDRVREALFSALSDVTGARVLDLYAGTGAFGIEALSRGAAHACFVEKDRNALAALRENVAALALEHATEVRALAVARAVSAIAGPFDLVFADPPYALVAELPPAFAKLRTNGAIARGARLVIEHASRDPAPAIVGATPRPTRVYGDTSVTIYDDLDAPT
jgi:16S rRNA (guanine966-N2)-methyltransferase